MSIPIAASNEPRNSSLDRLRRAFRESRGVNVLVWPGEFVARLLGIEDEDSRFLLRMFINLSVYGKVAVIAALLLMNL